jgi:uncharacterized membrane protein
MGSLAQKIAQAFVKNTMTQYFGCFIISMIPLIELRGAIPIAYWFRGMNPEHFNIVVGYVIIAIGNMLPVPIIFFFARKVLEWGKDKPVIGKFFTFCLEKGHKGGEKLQAKAGRGLFVALLLFVGIPLPGTGAWTGTLAASLLDMKFKESITAIMLGVALAGVIMGVASSLISGVIF